MGYSACDNGTRWCACLGVNVGPTQLSISSQGQINHLPKVNKIMNGETVLEGSEIVLCMACIQLTGNFSREVLVSNEKLRAEWKRLVDVLENSRGWGTLRRESKYFVAHGNRRLEPR